MEDIHRTLSTLLSQTLNPATQKQGTEGIVFHSLVYLNAFLAEQQLSALETEPGLSSALVSLLSIPDLAPEIRISGVVYLKNFVKKAWPQVSTHVN
jgi:hypothetical protein